MQRILQSSAENSAEIHKIYWEKNQIIFNFFYSNNFKIYKVITVKHNNFANIIKKSVGYNL